METDNKHVFHVLSSVRFEFFGNCNFFPRISCSTLVGNVTYFAAMCLTHFGYICNKILDAYNSRTVKSGFVVGDLVVVDEWVTCRLRIVTNRMRHGSCWKGLSGDGTEVWCKLGILGKTPEGN